MLDLRIFFPLNDPQLFIKNIHDTKPHAVLNKNLSFQMGGCNYERISGPPFLTYKYALLAIILLVD